MFESTNKNRERRSPILREHTLIRMDLDVAKDKRSTSKEISQVVHPDNFSRRLPILMAAAENPMTSARTLSELASIAMIYDYDPLLLCATRHPNASESMLGVVSNYVLQKQRDETDIDMRKHYNIDDTIEAKVDASAYWELILSSIANHPNAGYKNAMILKSYIRNGKP